MNPDKLIKRHSRIANFFLIVALANTAASVVADGWLKALCYVVMGVSVNIAVDHIVTAATYASAQTSVDVLLEVAKSQKEGNR